MNTLIKILVSLILICVIAAGGIYYYLFLSGDKTPLEQLVPSDAIAYADVKETRKLAIEIATSGQADAIAEIGKITGGLFALLFTQIENEDSTSSFSEMPQIEWQALLEAATHFNRQVAIFALESDIESLPFHGYAIAHFQGNSENFNGSIQTFLDSVNRELAANQSETSPYVIQTEAIDQYTINYIGLPQVKEGISVAWEINPSWTVIDGRCVFGLNPRSLAKYLDTLNSITPKTSLEQNANFALAAERQPKMDGQAYINVETFIEETAIILNETLGAQASDAGMSIDNGIAAMGLLEMETTFYTYDFDAISSTITQGVTYREPKGILSMYDHSSEMSPPSFIPLSSYSASSTAVDLGEMVLMIKDIILQTAPKTALMYPNYKQIADQQIGQDIEVFLQDTFANEFHAFSSVSLSGSDKSPYSDVSQSQVYVFGLSDVESFTQFLDEKISPFREIGIIPLIEENVAGFSTFVFNNPENPQSPSFGYSIAADKLFISYGTGYAALDSMRESLALLASNGPGAMQAPKISKFFDAHSEKNVAMSVIDVGTLLDVAIEFAERFKASADQTEDAQIVEILNQINWEALESFDIKMATISLSEDHLIFTKVRTLLE